MKGVCVCVCGGGGGGGAYNVIGIKREERINQRVTFSHSNMVSHT